MGEEEPHVFLDFAFNSVKVGRVVIKLFKNEVPKSVENFRQLCTGERGIGKYGKPLHYRSSLIHKVLPLCMVQGGDIINRDGTGGESIYGDFFPKEKCYFKHDRPGLVGLTVNNFNDNSSQFYITTLDCPQLDGQNVIIGEVVKGLDIINEMSEIPRVNDIPQEKIEVINCGEFKPNSPWNLEENDGTSDIYPPWPNDWDCPLDIASLTKILQNINDSGNQLFQNKCYLNAERKYRKIMKYIDWYLNKTNDKANNPFTEFQNTALLNLTAVRLKMDKNTEALQGCNEIIKINPHCGKAFYRRACAKLALKDYHEALRDLKLAYKLHPKDRAIRRTFELAKRRHQSYIKKEKMVYSKLFT